MTPRDSTDLHDKPLMVRVTVKPADGKYQASNEISGYAPVGDSAAAAPVAAAVPPWKRK